MPTARVLWLWPEHLREVPALREELEAFGAVDAPELDRPGLLDRVGGYDVLVPRLSQEIDAQVIGRAARLRLIGTPSTGADHIDARAAAARGIRVVSIKDDREFLDTVQATAELAWLLVLACSRNFRQATGHVLGGGWDSMAVRGHELIGRTLGVVGHGRLGTMVGRFGKAFRMRVLAADPAPVNEPGVEHVPLDDLLRRADIVTLHVHLNDRTRGLIGRREFALMRPGAVFVNTSRGGLVDEDALLGALREERLAAAGVDVIEGERDAGRNDRPLLRYAREHPNLIVTPHVGGCTVESQHKAILHFTRKLRRAWEEIAARGSIESKHGDTE